MLHTTKGKLKFWCEFAFTAIEVYGVSRMIRMTKSTVNSLYIRFFTKVGDKAPPILYYNNLPDDGYIIIS